MNDLEEKARKFAEHEHEGQLRNDGVTPYIKHPEGVVEILREYFHVEDDDVLSAAWLHDVVEDCGIAIETIRDEFGGSIAWMVYVMTRNVDREEYKKRILGSLPEIQKIKLADFCHNCRALEYDSEETTQRYLQDFEDFYLPLAKSLFAYKLIEDLEKSIARFKALSR